MSMWGEVLGDRGNLIHSEGESSSLNSLSLCLALGPSVVQAGCKDVQVLIHHELQTF